jgi:hypothetical protein
MKIRVKLFGGLQRALAPGARSGEMVVPANTTPRELMRRLELADDRFYILLVNDAAGPPDAYDSRKIAEGACVTICLPIAG